MYFLTVSLMPNRLFKLNKGKGEKMLKVGRKRKRKERKRKRTQTRLPGFALALLRQLLASHARNFTTQPRKKIQDMFNLILGAVIRVGRKGGTKVFRKKEPLGTNSHRTISKNSSGCRLLIRHKKCFVLLCPIGEQFLLSSFREFVHDGYLATLARFVHQACACKGSFYFLLS